MYNSHEYSFYHLLNVTENSKDDKTPEIDLHACCFIGKRQKIKRLLSKIPKLQTDSQNDQDIE